MRAFAARVKGEEGETGGRGRRWGNFFEKKFSQTLSKNFQRKGKTKEGVLYSFREGKGTENFCFAQTAAGNTVENPFVLKALEVGEPLKGRGEGRWKISVLQKKTAGSSSGCFGEFSFLDR